VESTLVLYRGDYEKIREFDISKTNRHCLVGRGIYLTDSLKVAQTYRTKGLYVNTGIITLAAGKFPTKGAVIEKAMAAFYEYRWKEVHGTEWSTAKGKEKELFRVKCLDEWERLKDQGKITIANEDVRIGTWVKGRIVSTIEKQTKVTYRPSDKVVGRISVFAFDNTESAFDTKVVNLSEVIRDERVREVMADIPYFNPLGVPKDEYVKDFIRIVVEQDLQICPGGYTSHVYNRFIIRKRLPLAEKEMTIIEKVKQRGANNALAKLARRLRDRGFYGFEYNGGVITSSIRHRAFCLWDDTFVNDHFIERRC